MVTDDCVCILTVKVVQDNRLLHNLNDFLLVINCDQDLAQSIAKELENHPTLVLAHESRGLPPKFVRKLTVLKIRTFRYFEVKTA